MRRLLAFAALVLAMLASTALPAGAQPFPERISLPDGWQPEGIAYDRGFVYSGSLAGGGIYRADVRTGEGEIIVEGTEGGAAVGLAVSRDGDSLFVAGGPTGDAFVYDLTTGETVAAYDFAEGETFVNDVILTREAAWFTDSFNQVVYRVALGPLGEPGAATTLPLTGDIDYVEGFNANGIEATSDGDTLIIVQGNTGQLFTVDTDTGLTDEIDLGDDDVTNGDGLLLRGRTLYVVENFDQAIATVQLSGDLDGGTVVGRTSDPGFDIPATIARRGGTLFAANARFTTPPTADTMYWITVLPLPLR